MQHNLCWLCALVFSSHDAASPCCSMHFQQFLFWLVSPYYQFVLDTHCSSKWFIWCFCCLSLFQDLRGVIQATWPAESIHLAVQMPGERLSFLRKKPLFYKSTSTSLHWKKTQKTKKKTRTSKTLLTTPNATYFQFRRKIQSYDPLIWTRAKMHQRTLNFRKDTEGKHSALKENQHKTAWLQGIQSTDNNDVTEQTAARLGHLLISSVFLELKANKSSTSISHERKKQMEIKRKHVFLEVYLSPIIHCSAGDSANCTCLNFKVTLYLLPAREGRDWQSLIPVSWK